MKHGKKRNVVKSVKRKMQAKEEINEKCEELLKSKQK